MVVSLVYFSVNISWGIALPILLGKTVITVNIVDNQVFWFGCFAGIYSLGQLLSYNIVGILCDRYGRKYIMVRSLLIFALMHLILALAIYKGHFFWILIARFVTGLFANYIHIGQSMIIDRVEETERKRFLNYYYVFANLPFAIVPFIFSMTLYRDLSTQPALYLVMPFMLLSALVILLVYWLQYYYRDPYVKQHDQHVSSFYWRRLKDGQARMQYGINFLIFTMMAIFYTAYPILLITSLDFTMDYQGYIIAFNNVVCMSSSILLIPFIMNKYDTSQLLNTHLILCALASIILLSVTNTATYLIAVLCICLNLCMLLPLCVTIIAKHVESHNQCKNLSINQSIKLLTKIIFPPLVGYWLEWGGQTAWIVLFVLALTTFTIVSHSLEYRDKTLTVT